MVHGRTNDGAQPEIPGRVRRGRRERGRPSVAHDLVIRGGEVADGLGGEPFAADVAVDAGTIVAVGDVRRTRHRGDRRGGPAGHPGLRGHPHALRRPGHVGIAHRAVVLARRDHRGDGQLRRRLRAGATRRARPSDRVDGGRRGHSGRRARRRHRLDLGELRRVPRRSGTSTPRHRPLRATAPRRPPSLCDGRAGSPPGGGDGGGRGGHAAPRLRSHGSGCHRVHDVAHAEPPHGNGRPDAVAEGGRGRARGHRAGRRGRRPRRRRAHLGLLTRRRGRVRHGPASGGAVRPAPLGVPGPDPRAARSVARAARADRAGVG